MVWDDEPVDRYLLALDCSVATPDRATIESLLAAGQLLWLDLRGVDEDVLALLRDVFALHPLAVEDVAEFGQRPKIDDYGDVSYLVSYGATSLGGKLAEVHCFYSEHFLITIRDDDCTALTQLREHLSRPGGQLPNGQRPTRLILLHHIMDTLIDSFFPVLSDFDDKIDDLQERIFAKPSNDELSELFSLQRWLVGVRKLVSPQRDMMASLAAGVTGLPGMTSEGEPYLRDLYDHLIRISDLIDSYRDLLSNAMDAYLSIVSNKLNEVMKQLAIIATIFLPLSFLTGFFGQNFTWLVGHLNGLSAFIALGVGTEVLAVACLYLLFRRRGWL
jgi:magnesium transporter